VYADSEQLHKAAQLIRQGRLVAFPTETVYGLGANALDANAVARIFSAKERPSFDPLIVHIAALDALETLTPMANDERVQALARQFWPGPLTLVLPKKDIVPGIVTSGLPTVGIRMPDHPLAQALIRESGCPLAAPSANKFGRLSPTQAVHVSRHLPEVDLVLDGGPTGVGIESTIIRLAPEGFDILRPGAVTAEQLSGVLPMVASGAGNDSGDPMAPGMMKSHYSPCKPLFIAGTPQALTADRGSTALLAYQGDDTEGYHRVIHMSEGKDLNEVAVNLFAAMHDMEADPKIASIIVEPVPEEDIGIALMDRIRKAAHDHQR